MKKGLKYHVAVTSSINERCCQNIVLIFYLVSDPLEWGLFTGIRHKMSSHRLAYTRVVQRDKSISLFFFKKNKGHNCKWLVHEVDLSCETSLSPPAKVYFTIRSKAVLFCGSFFVIYISRLSCFLVRLLKPCGHLLEKAGSWLSCVWCLIFVAFPFGVLSQVWCLIVSTPDLCLLLYFLKLTYKQFKTVTSTDCEVSNLSISRSCLTWPQVPIKKFVSRSEFVHILPSSNKAEVKQTYVSGNW